MKKFLIVAGAAMIVLLLAGLGGVALVSAQEPTPTPAVPFGRGGGGRGGFGRGGFSRGGFSLSGDSAWTMFDTVAETLDMTPEELFAELRAGKSLDEIAEVKGIELETVYDTVNAARSETMQQVIEQAVEGGSLSQEQADWMLEGVEQGFFPGGRGFGRGRMGSGYPEGECPCGAH